MNITLRVGAALVAVSTLSACATVTRGTHDTFRVVSVPPAADVKLTSGETCTTPCELKLKRKAVFDVTVSKSGYVSQSVHVRGVVKGGGGAAMAGNLIAGGLIGGIVDGSNGAGLDLKPNPVSVTLQPVDGSAPAAPAAPSVTAPVAPAAPSVTAPVAPATPTKP